MNTSMQAAITVMITVAALSAIQLYVFFRIAQDIRIAVISTATLIFFTVIVGLFVAFSFNATHILP